MSTCIILSACIQEVEIDNVFHQQIVVDGRIDVYSGAEVQLTTNLQYTDSIYVEDLYNAIIRWAKVTVSSDDGQEEILTGARSQNYACGFVYRSHKLDVREGGTYTLTVEYSGLTLTSTTTIPPKVEIDSLEYVPINDTLYTIKAHFKDPLEKNAYLIECQTDSVTYFRPSFLGIFDDSLFPDNKGVVTINRPLDFQNIGEYTQYFKVGEKVTVRFSNVGEFGYQYWSLYENEVLNTLNPIFPSRNNLPTNIVGDGRGIWCGYGSSYYYMID